MKRLISLFIICCVGLSSVGFMRAFPVSQLGIATCTTNGSDGFASAPIATIQYPTILPIGTYPTQPNWCVAGVNYAVGYPSATVLKDPFPAGVCAAALTTLNSGTPPCDGSNHIITFTTNGATVDGWDFSLENGWTVIMNGNNQTLQNNKWLVGSNLRPPIFIDINALNPTIKFNVIDGNAANINPAGGLIQGNGGGTGCGTRTIQYNWIKNSYYQHIQLGACGSATQTDDLIKFNIMEMSGYGAPFLAHGDIIQLFSSTGGAPSLHSFTADYNLILQNDPTNNWATQGFSIPYSGGNTLQVLTESAQNNVVLIPNTAIGASRNVNDAVLVDTSWMSGTATVSNNYIDPTGIASGGNFLTFGSVAGGAFTGTVTGSGNKNMKNGATCSFTPGSSGGSVNCP